MKQNIGTVDKVLRIIIALTVGIFLLTGVISGMTATILSIVAVIFLLTSLIGFCPLYKVCKISSRKQ